MSKYRKVLGEITAAAVVAQNDDVLAADFAPSPGRKDSLIRISVSVTTAVVVSLIGSDGVVAHFNGGVALTVGGIYTESIHLDSLRTWNVRTPDIAGTTFNVCTVVEVNE